MATDWLPFSKTEQLAMAKNWSIVLTAQAASWNIPSTELTQLDTLIAVAGTVLDKAQSPERTAVITAQCKATFDGLIEKTRFLKSHYFPFPPLTDTTLISLGLKPKDTVHTPVPPPAEQAEADILRPGVHLLELILRVNVMFEISILCVFGGITRQGRKRHGILHRRWR